VFAALTALAMTAATGLLCAMSLAARDSHPAAVLAWFAVGSTGGLCGGVAFAWLVAQLRQFTAPHRGQRRPVTGQTSGSVKRPDTAVTETALHPGNSLTDSSRMPAWNGESDDGKRVPWEALAAWADTGWTLGLAAVIALDANDWLTSDDAYIYSAILPVAAAGVAVAWGVLKMRRRGLCLSPGRTALALVCGLLTGMLVIAGWAGLGDLMRGMLAVVVGVHLAVTFATIA
jgi:hypothetical protein